MSLALNSQAIGIRASMDELAAKFEAECRTRAAVLGVPDQAFLECIVARLFGRVVEGRAAGGSNDAPRGRVLRWRD